MNIFKVLRTPLPCLVLFALLFSNNVKAQYVNSHDNSRGLFGRGMTEEELTNRNDDEISSGIVFQNFGEEAPLGNGTVVLLTTALSYLFLKKKEDEK